MHENCPVQEEVIYYTNDGFRPENTVVGWVDIGTSSRPITREVTGRVADKVEKLADGRDGVRVRTYARSYKGDYPLSLLGGRISRSEENESFEERELVEVYSREFAATLAYSAFAADPAILFPGVELPLVPALKSFPVEMPISQPVKIAA